MTHPQRELLADWEARFQKNTKQLELVFDCPALWVEMAVLLMLDEDPKGHAGRSLDDVERCLLKALELNSKHLEALEEAAHYYDAVMPNREKAVEYARCCGELAEKMLSEMQAIINSD
jgi:hypothetical protein